MAANQFGPLDCRAACCQAGGINQLGKAKLLVNLINHPVKFLGLDLALRRREEVKLLMIIIGQLTAVNGNVSDSLTVPILTKQL